MDKTNHLSFNAADRSYLALLKKEIHQLVTASGFSKQKIGEIDIIIAELTSNLVKHAGGGELLTRIFTEENNSGIEIITLDNGPGMKDPLRMMQDGISTTGTLGHGLGAIKRLSNEFQVYSLPRWGTITLTRVYKEENEAFRPRPRKMFKVNSLVVAKPGEQVSGDGFFVKRSSQFIQMLVADGLGHGAEAHLAVEMAIAAFRECREISPTEIIRHIHTNVKKTRGLVGTVIVLDIKSQKVRYCGVGNIATRFYQGLLQKTHIAYNGIIGLNIPGSLNDQELALEGFQFIIMCSDGIRSRWDISKYPHILKYDPTILAAAIYKDFGRRTDDMSVVITKLN